MTPRPPNGGHRDDQAPGGKARCLFCPDPPAPPLRPVAAGCSAMEERPGLSVFSIGCCRVLAGTLGYGPVRPPPPDAAAPAGVALAVAGAAGLGRRLAH